MCVSDPVFQQVPWRGYRQRGQLGCADNVVTSSMPDCQGDCVYVPPFVVLTLLGTTTLSSCIPTRMLCPCSRYERKHYSILQDQWKHDPFGAHKDENGDIYGRGTEEGIQ